MRYPDGLYYRDNLPQYARTVALCFIKIKKNVVLMASSFLFVGYNAGLMALFKNISAVLSRPTLLHYTLPLVIAYLVAGTVAQKYIGLYAATQLFFVDLILWVGVVPLPGFPILIAVIFLNLSFKLMYKSPWNKHSAGTIITHIGAMLLLLGGLFTALFSNEGYIEFAEGERKSFVSDYHTREFNIYDDTGFVVFRSAFDELYTRGELALETIPISLEILEACRNCAISARQNATEDFHGMAQHMQLSSADLHKTDEENMAGLTFRVKGQEVDTGVYVALENIPQYPEVEIGGHTYRFVLERQKRTLPFSIELIDFKRELYPGTQQAKSYESRVRIRDRGVQWESVISMNAPLRYKGYSFYQSSFAQTNAGEISVLAVVWNAGRIFPYISGLLMCLGMILHIFLRTK